MTARVLVTGATGFIGTHAVEALRERGADVHGIGHEVDLLGGDVRGVLQELRPTHLLHLAWYAVPGEYWTSTENYRWVGSTLELVRHFAESGGKRIVAAGTCAEGGTTAYAVCKDATRRLLDSFANAAALSFAWGRIFFLYGPHERPERLVPSVIRALLAGEPARCTEGTQIRDYLHVRDVAEAFAAIVMSDVTGTIDIASGEGTMIRDLVGRIGRQLGAADRLQFGALPPRDEPPVIVGDSTRLRNEVGWRPRFDLDSGLADTIGWFQR